MQVYIWQFVIALVVFLGLDAVWLTLAGRSIYAPELGALLREQPNFLVAFIFYLVFVVGLVGFVIHPATDIWQAVRMGALFGFVTYATYDLTNLSTINGFTTRIALIDLSWGTFLSATVSGVSIALLSLFKVG